mmetsp:Transcript_18223/g.51446  ORF Transcript_18223/g.51446 Transcript_18223/m.51446 type:complete len:106 (-) Transcript_18223:24-341(-)|eukprot:CAMPEP_0119120986 /NCGR_PEP_ID=MMETSP1310-20130426/1802_1 /TAXON_ID=464262 /ORGANISM="Genus nov. species nov., Strain RCC2339" /LENGTH=105 /DNA_ID=CAMNT_0007110513 /DNA_START=111 /DNA_END=428 /DNA_ORIENTATION=-
MWRQVALLGRGWGVARRGVSSSTVVRGGGGGAPEPEHDRDGILFGARDGKPFSPENREEWESIYYWGMGGALVLGFVGFYLRPDYNPHQWAREEITHRQEEAKFK